MSFFDDIKAKAEELLGNSGEDVRTTIEDMTGNVTDITGQVQDSLSGEKNENE
ncbi:MAG TPA: hypothetical protein VFH06_02675 [Candidatus Saccharimonadales bacterium]|nr:hypothetical protein [Candidatus Saccharimonadales bacterium]